jgi:hypothetical protein
LYIKFGRVVEWMQKSLEQKRTELRISKMQRILLFAVGLALRQHIKKELAFHHVVVVAHQALRRGGQTNNRQIDDDRQNEEIKTNSEMRKKRSTEHIEDERIDGANLLELVVFVHAG